MMLLGAVKLPSYIILFALQSSFYSEEQPWKWGGGERITPRVIKVVWIM